MTIRNPVFRESTAFLHAYYVSRLCALLERSNRVHEEALGYGHIEDARSLLAASGMTHRAHGHWVVGKNTLGWIVDQKVNA